MYVSLVCVGVQAFLQGGVGTKTGDGTSNQFWNVQHPEHLERGSGIRPAKNVPGQHGLGVFQDIKLTKRIYTHESSGYKVVATEAPSAHSGCVAVFYRAEEYLSIEVLQTYGANVVSFQMASGDSWWYIVG